MSMHAGPSVPLTSGSSLLRLLDSSSNLTILGSDTETSFMWVTADGNRDDGAVRRGNYLASRAGENMRCDGRVDVGLPTIIAQGLTCIRWRMAETGTRKSTGQACARPVP